MHATMKSLRNALGYAKFQDVTVHNRTLVLLDELGQDLDSLEYDPAPDAELARKELENAMNEYDQEVESLNKAIEDAKSIPETTEDEG